MKPRGKKKYILLEQTLPPRDEAALRQAVAAALPAARPSAAFADALERDLLAEAARQYDAQKNLHAVTRTAGIVGGGVLSVVGGILLWRLHQRRLATPVAASHAPVEMTTLTA